jgi:hypothetical protein
MADRPIPQNVTAAYIADALVMQSELLRRLSRGGNLELAELGELMGDMGKFYLSISAAIRESVTPAPDARPSRRENITVVSFPQKNCPT